MERDVNLPSLFTGTSASQPLHVSTNLEALQTLLFRHFYGGLLTKSLAFGDWKFPVPSHPLFQRWGTGGWKYPPFNHRVDSSGNQLQSQSYLEASPGVTSLASFMYSKGAPYE